SAKEGTASVVLGGLYIGKISAFQATILIAASVYLIYWVSGGMISPEYGVYGTSIGAVAVLSILPIILALDAQGAISDMAQGNLTMSGINGVRLDAMNKMDSLGNTMAAMVKGIAIISGVLTAIVLAYAFRGAINKALLDFGFSTEIDYSLFNIEVLTGILVGAASPHLFSAKFFKSVPATTKVMMDEIKRQIRDLGIFRGENEPDYDKCVDLATRAAQKNSIGPAIFAVGLPVGIGIVLGPAGILAYLLSALASGFIEAIVMSNAGGAWDNSKKLYEAKPDRDKHSAEYKSLIDGDVIGDTTKDVAGPSQNILIKLQITVSIFTAPLQVYLHYLLTSSF
ncbi:sodium-translocating pyrophosphatase, partial [Candidatus Falkowbacteria bacterium HGW-Falkowbacteria-2]